MLLRGAPVVPEPAHSRCVRLAVLQLQLDRLLADTKACFDLSACREFTVEAGRPDTVTEEKLAVLVRMA